MRQPGSTALNCPANHQRWRLAFATEASVILGPEPAQAGEVDPSIHAVPSRPATRQCRTRPARRYDRPAFHDCSAVAVAKSQKGFNSSSKLEDGITAPCGRGSENDEAPVATPIASGSPKEGPTRAIGAGPNGTEPAALTLPVRTCRPWRSGARRRVRRGRNGCRPCTRTRPGSPGRVHPSQWRRAVRP